MSNQITVAYFLAKAKKIRAPNFPTMNPHPITGEDVLKVNQTKGSTSKRHQEISNWFWDNVTKESSIFVFSYDDSNQLGEIQLKEDLLGFLDACQFEARIVVRLVTPPTSLSTREKECKFGDTTEAISAASSSGVGWAILSDKDVPIMSREVAYLDVSIEWMEPHVILSIGSDSLGQSMLANSPFDLSLMCRGGKEVRCHQSALLVKNFPFAAVNRGEEIPSSIHVGLFKKSAKIFLKVLYDEEIVEGVSLPDFILVDLLRAGLQFEYPVLVERAISAIELRNARSFGKEPLWELMDLILHYNLSHELKDLCLQFMYQYHRYRFQGDVLEGIDCWDRDILKPNDVDAIKDQFNSYKEEKDRLNAVAEDDEEDDE